jgi:hypothetical protein
MQFTSQLEQGDWYIVASWLCVVSTLLLYGIGVALAKMRQAVGRARAKRKRARALAGLGSHHPRRVPSHSERPALPQAASFYGSHAHWSSAAAILEAGLAGAEAASASHASAGRHIDAAEYALNRLLADLIKVMPRAQPTLAEPARPLPQPTRVAEPLAA